MPVNTCLLFGVVIVKFDVICMYLTEVRIQYQQLFETGVARDKIIVIILARSSFELGTPGSGH